jgi:hypothetical protein
VHKVVCLELDTFQELRGQGQISDINKVDTWRNFRHLLFYLYLFIFEEQRCEPLLGS